MSGKRRWVAFVLAGLIVPMAFGQDKPPVEKAAPKIDPKVAEVVRQVSDYFKGLKSFSVDVSRTMTITGRGMKQETVTDYNVAMRRPNLLAIVLKTGTGATLVCDGKNFSTYVPMLSKYTVHKAPADLDALLTGTPESAIATQMLFADDLMRSDPYSEIMEGVTSASYAGIEEIGGVKYHHLKFVQEEFDWEMWVSAGDKPLLLKVVPDLTKSMPKGANAPPGMSDMKMQTLIRFDNWAVNPQLPDERFKFTPPPGAQKVENFMGTAPEGPHPLTGKPAPDFKLDLLDGGKLALSEHKDKQVVILDFWATWCGPCRRAMPIIAAVAAAYKDKGVLLYAVNEDEPVEKIREFLKTEKLAVTVALDKDGKVGQLYGANAIPQTVIVGKDGVVQVVHVGLMPDLKAKLTGELDALVAGKKPAGEAQQK